MSILFEPYSIGNIEIRNRFVRSATGDSLNDERGYPTQIKIDRYAAMAKGGIGLIITGVTTVWHMPSNHYLSQNMSYIGDDNAIPAFRKLTDAVHAHGAKIAVQLFHPGREQAAYLKGTGIKAIAPSFISDDPIFTGAHRSMEEGEILQLINRFGDGGRRAREAGFDFVQLHGAHGYLFSQFLSPATNHRQDHWGGSLSNRLRLHHNILLDIKAKAGNDYPVMIKLGVEDVIPDGLNFDDGCKAAKLLEKWGFESLEISQGIRGKSYQDMEFRPDITHIDQEAYFREWAKQIKPLVNVPIMMVGGLRSFELCDQIIQEGEADFISMCRPFICEPSLIARWINGDRRKARCTSCNLCLDKTKDDLVCPLDISE
jgi:2,4-dienoyl-CoA reductase-like NADH-dependent reductase (Old Yellow Enzyme family)